jgi:hypothetical protein
MQWEKRSREIGSDDFKRFFVQWGKGANASDGVKLKKIGSQGKQKTICASLLTKCR